MACGIASGGNSASGAQPAAVSGSGQGMAPGDLPAVSPRGSFSKSQVVYAKLDATGTPEGVFVVNSFESVGGAAVQDLGRYDGVVNLTDSQDIASGDGIARFEVDGRGRFRYQGNLPAGTLLPWNVRAAYSIDGERRDAAELAGAASPDALAGLDLASMAAAASADAMPDGGVAALQADFADALAELVTTQATKAGLGSAADALSGAQSGYAQLDDGVQGVLDASSPKSVYTLAEAARQLAEGAGELAGRTADIDQQLIAGIRRELQSYLNPDYEAADFASPSNDHTVAVQFALMTASI